MSPKTFASQTEQRDSFQQEQVWPEREHTRRQQHGSSAPSSGGGRVGKGDSDIKFGYASVKAKTPKARHWR
jgi:hypothetical protein